MTKKKILLFLAVVMLYLTANMSGVFAWFTTYDSKELTVTSGVFVKPYLVSGEEFNEITSPVKSTVKKVEFMNTIPDLSDYKEGKTKFDVSKEQDGSVIAWVDENSTMYIGGRGGIIADQSLNTMFSYYTSVKEVIFKKVLNTKDSISARNMFLSCENLKTTDINNIDTSQIQNFQMMFANCQNIVELDISSWNVKSAKNMSGMFLNCNTLRTLKMGTKHAESVETFENMFKDCRYLIALDLSHFYTRDGVNYKKMFLHSSIQELDLSGFKMREDSNLSQMFGYMDTLDKVYVSENWSETVKTDCLPFWMCTGLTHNWLSEQEGIDWANYETGYFTYKQMEAE